MVNNSFTMSSDYGEKTIRESKKGWLVEGWSRYQGSPTNYKFLIPFENCKFKKGENLNDICIKKGDIPADPYNEYTKGECLLRDFFITMDNDRKIIKILNWGFPVQ